MEPGQENQHRSWQINVILTAGVISTVLLAFILTQLDTLQVRAVTELPGLPIVNVQATAVAIGQIISLDESSEEGQAPPAAVPVPGSLGPVPDDVNPRPEFITGVSEEGVIFTVCGAVPEGWLLYTVQPGDTLASLAEATQSTAADLSAANCLETEQLSGGMQLLVPQQPAVTLCGPPSWWVRYLVRPGDTLTRLAFLRGTTVEEILRANCREEMDLQAGQYIFLPPGPPSGGVAPVPQPSLTPLPTPTPVPTLAPLPSMTSVPPPVQPTATPIVIFPSPTRPPTAVPTAAPPTFAPPTSPPPTSPPPTSPPPTSPPPTSPPPTSPPPTDTPVPPPTDTPVPPPTDTPVPPPTDTPVPPPTDTPVPPPTDTPVPPPTDTPVPPPTMPPDEGGG